MSGWSAWAVSLALAAGLGGCGHRPGPLQLSARDNSRSVLVEPGAKLEIRLDSNPSTGFAWRLASPPDADVLRLLSSRFVPAAEEKQPVVGRKGAEVWRFEAQAPGATSLRLVYVRRFEPDRAKGSFTLRIRVGPEAERQLADSPGVAPTARVRVFFPKGSPGLHCDRVLPVTRTVPAPAVLRGALTALLLGPTAAERRAGYGGWFSARTKGMLRGVRLSDRIAHVDFRDFRRLIPNASSSCGSALLLAQLDRTATQFPTVRRAVYSFSGSRRAFYEWLQLSTP